MVLIIMRAKLANVNENYYYSAINIARATHVTTLITPLELDP
jgi:hypothetical protein